MKPKFLALLVVLSIIALCWGCSDDSVTPAPPEPVDVNAYMESLPEWNQYSPLLPDNESIAGEPEYNPAHLADNVRYVCKSTPVDLTRTPEKVQTYSPSPGVLWLGALIQGETYAGVFDT